MSLAPCSFPVPARILLPIDFSASSYAALAVATDWAEHLHAELELLHIIPTTPDWNGSDFFPNTERLEEMRSDIEAKLESSGNDARSKGLHTSWTIETGNDVADTIMLVIERDHVDLLIISTHGLSGWRPLIFGSTAAKVLKLVHCPLLLLPSPKPVTTGETPIGTAVGNPSEDQ